MALSPFVRASQAQFTVTISPAVDVRASQAQTMAAVNFPSEAIQASQGQALAAITPGVDVRVSQAAVYVAARGRISNPRLRAWTFSLDGHDFYVLRLGDRLTLVYDLTSEQWVDWADFNGNFWRPNVGINWRGGTGLGHDYGSNVLIGDDTFGLLWFLDPNQPYDQHPDYLNHTQEVYFERITMGQVPMRGRESIQCFAAWLTTDMGQPAYDGAGVRLSISDDAGVTFDDMGLVTVTLGATEPELSWYSLGQINAPGRLFKIEDDGAIARIDGMEMNDPDDDGR